MCVAVVLGDALHRVSVLGGREGLARSLGSVYGGVVTRFLGGGLRGVESRVIDTPGVWCGGGVAVSVDGCTLVASDGPKRGAHAVVAMSAVDGSVLRVVGEYGPGPLQFNCPRQVWVASDGFVFVADSGNDRVQVLTPDLSLDLVVGEGQVRSPEGVCANADVIVVSQRRDGLLVFRRHDGALLRKFGSRGTNDDDLDHPTELCFMNSDRHVAVVDVGSERVSVFSLDGMFIRHVGEGVLEAPCGVAASAHDELIVPDSSCVRVFSDAGDVLMTLGVGNCTGVASHGNTLFAADYDAKQVVLWS